MASAVARAMGPWAMGRSPQRSPGAEPLVGDQGTKPSEAGALLICGHSMEAANLPTFLKFGTHRNQMFVLSLQKIMGGHETGGGVGAKLGACAPLSARA